VGQTEQVSFWSTFKDLLCFGRFGLKREDLGGCSKHSVLWFEINNLSEMNRWQLTSILQLQKKIVTLKYCI